MDDVFMMDYRDKQASIQVPNDDAVLGIDESLGTLTKKYSSFEYPDPSDPHQPIVQSGSMNSGLTPNWTMTVGIDKTDSSSATLRAPGEQTRDPL